MSSLEAARFYACLDCGSDETEVKEGVALCVECGGEK